MRSAIFGELFDIGKDILHAGLNAVTKVAAVQLGDSTGQVPDSDAAELWQAPGLLSLPAEPTPGSSSCQGIAIKCGDRDRVIACRDTRCAATCADMVPGETSIFGTGPACNAANGRVVTRVDGTVQVYATGCLITVAPSGLVTIDAAQVKLGGAPSSAIVLGDLLTPQLAALAASDAALLAAIENILGGPGVANLAAPQAPLNTAAATAVAAAATALAVPNGSTTCLATH